MRAVASSRKDQYVNGSSVMALTGISKTF